MKAFKAFIKLFEAPQKGLKIKILVDVLSSSGMRMRRVTISEVVDIPF